MRTPRVIEDIRFQVSVGSMRLRLALKERGVERGEEHGNGRGKTTGA